MKEDFRTVTRTLANQIDNQTNFPILTKTLSVIDDNLDFKNYKNTNRTS